MQLQSDPKFKHFFAVDTGSLIQASFASERGRKNYQITKACKAKEEAPMAIESFALEPSDYAELMSRVEAHLQSK
jgi:hypothetical protein